LDISALEPIVQEAQVEALLRTPQLHDFIKESFRQILKREVDPPSLRRFSLCLRFWPFFSRRRFICTLLNSDEHLQLLQSRLGKLEQVRQMVQQQHQVLARAEQAFELQRQVQEKQKIVNQAERRHWDTIESVFLSKHEHLLEIDRPETFVSEAYQEMLGRPPAQPELDWGRSRLEAGFDRLKRDLLHQIIGKDGFSASVESPIKAGPPQPIHQMFGPKPTRRGACRVCAGPLAFKWSLAVLLDKYIADYYECLHCRALQIPHPFWLDEAYDSENSAWMCNPDTGRFVRNFSTYRYLAALIKAQVFPAQPQFLDFAGGYGLLTQMLHSAGHKAWLTDLYVSTPFFASDRYIRDFNAIPENSFDVITALEVVEHLTEPVQVVDRLRRILKPDGALVISTGIYQPGVHDSGWGYLASQWGQHVTFWSKDALEACAAKTGFRSVSYFPSDQGVLVLVLFSMLSADEMASKLDHAFRLLQDVHHLQDVVAVWDYLTHQNLKPLPKPEVREVKVNTSLQATAA
jgi:SAM-dependent methyltransferase